MTHLCTCCGLQFEPLFQHEIFGPEGDIRTVICGDDVPVRGEKKRMVQHCLWDNLCTAHLTGPILSIFSLVSGVNGVEARTQTSPEASFIAVVRPPIGRKPKRKNGLRFGAIVSRERTSIALSS